MNFAKANKLYFKDRKGNLRRLDKVSPILYYYVYSIFIKGYGTKVLESRISETKLIARRGKSKYVGGAVIDVYPTGNLIAEFNKKINQNFITVFNGSIDSELCNMINVDYEKERQKAYYVQPYISNKKPTQESTWWERLIAKLRGLFRLA